MPHLIVDLGSYYLTITVPFNTSQENSRFLTYDGKPWAFFKRAFRINRVYL